MKGWEKEKERKKEKEREKGREKKGERKREREKVFCFRSFTAARSIKQGFFFLMI